MRRELFLSGLCFFSTISLLYCPVKTTPLDRMWRFLSRALPIPSEWGGWSAAQKEEWNYMRRCNPTLLMTEEQNQTYITILSEIHRQLSSSSLKNEEWRESIDEVRKRLAAAEDTSS